MDGTSFLEDKTDNEVQTWFVTSLGVTTDNRVALESIYTRDINELLLFFLRGITQSCLVFI